MASNPVNSDEASVQTASLRHYTLLISLPCAQPHVNCIQITYMIYFVASFYNQPEAFLYLFGAILFYFVRKGVTCD